MLYQPYIAILLSLCILFSPTSKTAELNKQRRCHEVLTGTVAEQLEKANNVNNLLGYTSALQCYLHILESEITAVDRMKALHALTELHEQNDNAEEAITVAESGYDLALTAKNESYSTIFSIDLLYAHAAKQDYAKAYSIFLKIPPPDNLSDMVKAQYYAGGARIFGALGFKATAAELTLKVMDYEDNLSDSDKANSRYNLALILVRDKQCEKALRVSAAGRRFALTTGKSDKLSFDILDAEIAICRGQPRLAYDLLKQDEHLVSTLPGTFQTAYRLYQLEAATALGITSAQHLFLLESLLNEHTYDSLKKRALLALAKGANSLGLYEQAYLHAKSAIELTEQLADWAASNQEVKWNVEYELNTAKMATLAAENRTLLQQKKAKTLLWALAALLIVNALLVCFTHITKAKMHIYRKISNQDALTGAPNRRAVLRHAETMLSSRRHNLIAVSLIDLDNFKTVNDTYGHTIGDTVLQCFAHACDTAIRTTDHFGRIGGEEWLIISAIKDTDDVQLMFNRLRDIFQKRVLQQTGLTVSFSMGSVVVSERKTIAELLQQADTNLYQVKNTGKDSIYVTGI